jgi:N-methylhydantoinase A/oxoprolinase/acetone carboxylase beta subunit
MEMDVTTEVIVKANHGWPVRVVPLSVGGSYVGPVRTVEAGTEMSVSVHSGQDLLIHEIQPSESTDPSAPVDPMLVHFAFQHLPEDLKVASLPFAMTAARIVDTLPASAERSVCLRKLLEAKDCAVRAAVAAR